ncbi:MAG TPA: peptide chain release factor N(5)-glutamine methyltransferase [Bacteroidota bacterium]|nr:peptide chain release factor N(5)-glutamine methyltransferase [Bacteroidota bacterium]
MTSTMPHGAVAPPQTWTILSLLGWAESYLRDRSFDECRLNAELMLAHVLALPRLNLYLQFDRPLTAEELAAFKALFHRRLAHEPLQYILGDTEFMGLRLEVGPGVLIPRPETESLVEYALQWLKEEAAVAPRILEIGTGSGNIAVALARFLSSAKITSFDVSAEALAFARRNAARHDITNIEFLSGDVFHESFKGERFDCVLSNPPYVSSEEFVNLQPEVRDFEPPIATTDGADGFRFIRRVAELSAGALREGGALFMEIGYNQDAEAVEIVGHAGLERASVARDFAGIPRVLRAYAPHRSE